MHVHRCTRVDIDKVLSSLLLPKNDDLLLAKASFIIDLLHVKFDLMFGLDCQVDKEEMEFALNVLCCD
jgi:hypothetical protein